MAGPGGKKTGPMISFDDALSRLRSAVSPLGAEDVPLADAHGRVLADPVRAASDAPFWDVATMDGYAVAGEGDAFAAIGRALPGRAFDRAIGEGEAVRIFTGAPVPAGTAKVVPQEVVARDGDTVRLLAPSPERFIRARASDFAAGDTLLSGGTRLGARALVAAAAADQASVRCVRRPRLRLLATGDEIAPPGSARDRPGAIPDSISLAVLALARDWGAEAVAALRRPDDLPQLVREAPALLAGADILVVSGGASVGERDFGKAMFGDALDLLFAVVRIKPGKPVWLGRTGGTWVVGLPGNPTSALVTARLILVPLITALLGRDPDVALAWEPLPVASDLPGGGDRETFSRARADAGVLHLLPNQDSGAQHMLAAADWLVRRPAGAKGVRAGEIVPALRF